MSQALGVMPALAPAGGWPVARVLPALVGGVLLADGLVLMALMHFNVGVLVPAALGAVLLAVSRLWWPLARWRCGGAGRQRLWRLGWWGLFAWTLSLLLFWQYMLGVGRAPQEVPAVQAIVVLGSGTLNGKPRPVLAARLDTAAELARLQPGVPIVVSGGVDWGETDSEATAMARYLEQRHGVPAERLLLEHESTSTDLNLQLSRPLLAARGIDVTAPLAMVSSDFHLLRSMGIAQRQGWSGVVPVAAPTPLATRYNAWLREYFAMLSSRLLREV